jgi:hypothetical protein
VKQHGIRKTLRNGEAEMAYESDMTTAQKREMLIKMIFARDYCNDAIALLCAALRSDQETEPTSVERIQKEAAVKEEELVPPSWLGSRTATKSIQ